MGCMKLDPERDLMGYSEIHRPLIYSTLGALIQETTDLHCRDNGVDLVVSKGEDFKFIITFRTSFLKIFGEREIFCSVVECADFVVHKYEEHLKTVSLPTDLSEPVESL